MKYTAHMWPFFLYSSTQYGRAAAASCVPRMHKSQFDREKGVWGEFTVQWIVSLQPWPSFLCWKRLRPETFETQLLLLYAMRFLGLSSLKMKIPLLFSSFNTCSRYGKGKKSLLHITYLGVLAARELILWIHSIWQSHSNGLSDSEISVYPWSTKKMS